VSSIIGAIQQQCADQIAAAAFFAHITVLTEQIGDIINQMEMALGSATSTGGKAGAFVCVMTPAANVNFPDVGGPFFSEINVSVQVTVNVPVAEDANIGVLVTALEICEQVCAALHQFYPAAANAPLVGKSPTVHIANREDNIVTYLCEFKTMGGIRTVPPQVALPVLVSDVGGVVTLSCATPGAAMFYTTDGSNASPRNGTFYTAPFTPGAPLTLKVRAWLAGYLASETLTHITIPA
jgi:hypothetical protein